MAVCRFVYAGRFAKKLGIMEQGHGGVPGWALGRKWPPDAPDRRGRCQR